VLTVLVTLLTEVQPALETILQEKCKVHNYWERAETLTLFVGLFSIFQNS